MKSKIASILLISVFIFSCCGCGQSTVSRTYDDFQISFPQTWTVNTDTDVAESQEATPFLYVSAPSVNENSTYFYVVYMSSDSIDSLDEIDQDFGDSWAEVLSSSISIDMSCESVKKDTFGSRQGALVTFTGSSNGLDLTYIEQLVPTGDRWYVFTYLMIDKQNKGDIQRVIDSVKFTES
ncbi:MAG: hypothetical protein ACC608_08540 [Anaerofustis sp.]